MFSHKLESTHVLVRVKVYLEDPYLDLILLKIQKVILFFSLLPPRREFVHSLLAQNGNANMKAEQRSETRV